MYFWPLFVPHGSIKCWAIVFIFAITHIFPGRGIRCFVGNNTVPTEEDIIDCSTLGIQREELYCRNVSIYDTGDGEKRLIHVHRKCAAMSWYGVGWEAVGCHDIPNKETSGGKIRCTCATDLCNAPVDPESMKVAGSSSAAPRPIHSIASGQPLLVAMSLLSHLSIITTTR